MDDSQDDSLNEALRTLSLNAREFYLHETVAEREAPLDPLEFYREWVAPNRPVIFKNALSRWPAMSKWKNEEYLRKTIGKSEVTVSVTPNGYADSYVFTDQGLKFVMPHEQKMTMNDFLDVLIDTRSHSGVHYIQKQNSNLTDEFSELLSDTFELSWAREAFGKSPDAVNFWMGDERAVTSTHKDPYENIFCVVKGYKDILLFPPTDLPWLPYRKCRQAKYAKTSDGFEVQDLSEMPEIPWIVIDPLNPDLERFPEFEHASPISVRVNEGDAFYLPSLWFHHLRQSHGCIAVNFWYDMEYDIKWNYFQLLSNLVMANDSNKNDIDSFLDW